MRFEVTVNADDADADDIAEAIAGLADDFDVRQVEDDVREVWEIEAEAVDMESTLGITPDQAARLVEAGLLTRIETILIHSYTNAMGVGWEQIMDALG